MKRTSALAGSGLDNGNSPPSTPTRDSMSSSGLHRSNSSQAHLRQGSLTSACLPASSPDFSKRSRFAGFFPLTASAADPSASSSSSRRRSLPMRLFQMAYLTFALVYTTLSLLGLLGQDMTARGIISKEAADQLPLGGMGDAWQAMRDRIPFQPVEEEMDQPEGASVVELEDEELPLPLVADEIDFEQVSRTWHGSGPDDNPLSPMSHPYRFSKTHSKLAGQVHDQITPFAYRATSTPPSTALTACLYTNEAWLDFLPEVIKRWTGPISLVVETLNARDSEQRADLLQRIQQLRDQHSELKTAADIHLVQSTAPNMTLLLTQPIASNAHTNIARFFARTDTVLLLPDARLIPSQGLQAKLATAEIGDLLRAQDGIVVPTFAPVRRVHDPQAVPNTPILSEEQELGQASSAEEARVYVEEHLDSLLVPLEEWPSRKAPLVGMASVNPPSSVMNGRPTPDGPIFGLFDRSWDLNHGPTNWLLWRRNAAEPTLARAGANLGVDGSIGGGDAVYRVKDYELHYAPVIAMSREGHPWCSERFDRNPAACGYATWLAGAEFWVIPDEWVYTLEAVDAVTPELNDADRLKESIAARLYTKYHAEACMHFGREFLSKGIWETARSKHLKAICGKVLKTWGMDILQPGSK